MVDTYLEGNRCPHCDYSNTGATCIQNEEAVPYPGDLTICIGCGQINQFDQDMKSQQFPLEELFDLPDDFRLELVRQQQAVLTLVDKRKANE